MEELSQEVSVDTEQAEAEAIAKFTASQEQAEPEAQPEQPAEEPGAESAAEPEVELRSTQLAAIARRERELREREEQLKAKEAELQRDATPEPEDKGLFGRIDVTALSAQDRYALATYELLGDETPSEIIAKVKQIEMDSRFNELKESQSTKNDKDEVDPALRAEARVVLREIGDFLEDVPESYGMLSGLSKNEPDTARQLIAAVMDEGLSQSGSFMSVRKAAQIVADSLAEDARRYDKLRGIDRDTQPEAKPQTKATDSREAVLSEAEALTTPTRTINDDLPIDEVMELARIKYSQM